jgi:nucleoside-diphosphate-sugar epimerase
MLVQLLAAALGKDAPRLRLPQALVRPVALAGALIPGFPLSLSRVDALTNRSIFRSGRIHAELGYEYRISLEAGMSELVRHWQTRPTGA